MSRSSVEGNLSLILTRFNILMIFSLELEVLLEVEVELEVDVELIPVDFDEDDEPLDVVNVNCRIIAGVQIGQLTN